MTPSKRFAELLRSLFARTGRRHSSSSSTRGPRRSRALQLECLEDRTLPATTLLFVTNTGNQGTGSLRQAIANANAVAGSDPVEIRFSIPTSDKGFANGVYTI